MKSRRRSLRKHNKRRSQRSLRKHNKRRSQRSLRKHNKRRSQRGAGIENLLTNASTIVFGIMSCPFTSGAVELLNKNKIKHTFYDLTKEVNKTNLDSLKEKNIVSNTWNTIPVIIQYNKFIGGMTDLESKLNSEP